MGWRWGLWVAGVLAFAAFAASLYWRFSPGVSPDAIDLAEQTRLVLVETANFDSSAATITVFERSAGNKAWIKIGTPLPAIVGRNGLGWGYSYRHLAGPGEPIKQEGDKRAPAGFFKFGQAFGLLAGEYSGHMQLEKERHFCVDDVGSENYSEIVPADTVKPGTSGERMWSINLYKRGIVIDYPTDRFAKSGSCIFLHVWKSPETPTVGCIAAAEDTVAGLQRWVSEAPNGAEVAIVPKDARDRLGLNLPD